MTDPIHFAARIEQTPRKDRTDHPGQATQPPLYFAACGYAGYNPEMFTDIYGRVKKSLGGRVTCRECIVKIVRKIVERIEGTHD